MTPVAASTTQVTLAASNSSRNGLLLVNQSPATLYVSTVNGFTKANAPIVIAPNGRWPMSPLFTGALYGVWDAATGRAQVTEV